jgi:hypothetical protein
MEAVDIMKGLFILTKKNEYFVFSLFLYLDIRRLSADDRKKNSYEPVIKLVEGYFFILKN